MDASFALEKIADTATHAATDASPNDANSANTSVPSLRANSAARVISAQPAAIVANTAKPVAYHDATRAAGLPAICGVGLVVRGR